MIPALCGLFLLDAGFIGFRDAAGREGRIFKWQGYYQRAVLRGVTAGLLALGGVGAVAAVALFLGPANTLETWEQALQPMLAVYSAYTLAVLSALSLWLVPLVEFRTLASVLVLGPFTLIRPLVVLLGALMTMAVSPTVEVFLPACAVVLAGNGLEPLLERRHRRARAAQSPAPRQ